MVSDKLRKRREQIENKSMERSFERYNAPVIATSDAFDPYPNLANQIMNQNGPTGKASELQNQQVSTRDPYGNLTLVPNITAVPLIGSGTGKHQTPYANNILNDTSLSIQSGAALSSKYMSSQMTRAGAGCGPAGVLSANNLAETKATIGTGLSGFKKNDDEPTDVKEAASNANRDGGAEASLAINEDIKRHGRKNDKSGRNTPSMVEVVNQQFPSFEVAIDSQKTVANNFQERMSGTAAANYSSNLSQ